MRQRGVINIINLSTTTLENVTDPNYVVGCTDAELIKLIAVANTIFDLANNELKTRK